MIEEHKSMEENIEMQQKRKKADPVFELRTGSKKHSSDELNQSYVDDDFKVSMENVEKDQTCWEAFCKLVTF